MTTQYIDVKGTTMWAKVVNPDTKYVPHKYKVPLILSQPELKKVKDSGITLRPKKTEDGVLVTFTRPVSKNIKGVETEFGPPEVLMDGKPYDGFIGNGSEVTLNVSVYDTPLGKGHRLNKVIVHKLVEYNPEKPPVSASEHD